MGEYDVIILGAGPAGLTAAIYATRAALKTLVLTGNLLGGQAALTTEIENYPGFPEVISGPELTQRLQKQAEKFGAEIVMEEATAVDLGEHPFLVRTLAQAYRGKTLIVATGASPRRLGVPGEAELIGRGVSFCATCDGYFFRDREVAVVGGGDSAVKEALFLAKLVRKVYLIHRRDRLRAEAVSQKQVLEHPRIEVLWNTVVTEIVGKGAVEGLRLRDLRTGAEAFLKVAGVFIYIGHVPNTALFQGKLALDEEGYIVTDRAMHTSVPGVFAAGAVQERILDQLVTAVATGAIAAMEAEKFLAQLQGRGHPGWGGKT
jgi:thioredoxin reductase (NADPH)